MSTSSITTTRSLHLVDIENLVGDPYAAPGVVLDTFDRYLELAGWRPHDHVIVAPPEFPLPEPVMRQLGDVKVVHDQTALASQQVVYAKSWGSLLDYGVPPPEQYRDWIVTREKLGRAAFMHCLPLRRNVEVADDVLDGDGNAAYDEAENRLHVQKEILLELLA